MKDQLSHITKVIKKDMIKAFRLTKTFNVAEFLLSLHNRKPRGKRKYK